MNRLDELKEMCFDFKHKTAKPRGVPYPEADKLKIIEIVKLGHECLQAMSDIYRMSGISAATVSRTAKELGLDWTEASIHNRNLAREARRKAKEVARMKALECGFESEEIAENRFFSTMIMKSKPEALERISYREVPMKQTNTFVAF